MYDDLLVDVTFRAHHDHCAASSSSSYFIDNVLSSLYSYTISFVIHYGFNFDVVALQRLMHNDFQVIEPSVSFS